MTVDPDGSGASAVRGTRRGAEPRWSPDGRQLAFTRGAGLYVVSSGGGSPRLVARDAAAPAWSPDGERLAFMRLVLQGREEVANPMELFLVGADGRGLRRLTTNEAYDGEPAWSPEGDLIVFATDDGLYLSAPDGSRRRPLILGGYYQNPVWSPDGRTILYDDGVDVFTVDVESGRRTRLTKNPGPDRDADWAPNGKRIVYMSLATCRRCFSAETPLEIWVMDADGSSPHRIAGTRYASPDWGP